MEDPHLPTPTLAPRLVNSHANRYSAYNTDRMHAIRVRPAMGLPHHDSKHSPTVLKNHGEAREESFQCRIVFVMVSDSLGPPDAQFSLPS